MRICLALVTALPLLASAGCDALVEEPAPLRAHFVRPESGTQARELHELAVEVALDGCDQIRDFDLFANGELLLRVDHGFLDFDRLVFDCPFDANCVNLFPSDLMEGGVLSTVELRAEVHCESTEFAATTDPILVAASPFTGAVTLEASGDVELAPLPTGQVAVQTSTALHLVDGSTDRVVAVRDGAGRPFAAGNVLYAVNPCTGADCGAAGQLVRLSPSLDVDAGPAALECEPIDVVSGPLDGQVTVYGNDTAAAMCWQIFDAALALVASGSHSRQAIEGGAHVGQAVRLGGVNAAPPHGLFRLQITAAGVAERDLGVALTATNAAALADDGSWFLAREDSGWLRVDHDAGGRERIEPGFELGELRELQAHPGGQAIMIWGENGLASIEPQGVTSGLEAATLALATRDALAFLDGSRRVQAIGLGLGADDFIYGPLPETWQPIAGTAGRDGWFHMAFATPQGLVVGSIQPGEAP